MRPEDLLPESALATAVRSGNEIGWHPDDLSAALSAAESAECAVVGGQLQFIVPDGTCELYWRAIDSSGPQRASETWFDYVRRSHAEVREALRRLPDMETLVADGVKNFGVLEQLAAAGVDLVKYACFICYFEVES
jgi:hypothetical protein